MYGAPTQPKQDNNGKILNLVQKHKFDLETHLNSKITQIEVISYTTQVVSGTNYKVMVKINGGHIVEVVIYEKLECYGGGTSLTSFVKKN